VRNSSRLLGARIAATALAVAGLATWATPNAIADANSDEIARQNAAAAAAARDVDSLTAQRAAAAAKAADAQAQIEESSAVLAAASAKLQQSQVNLAGAQAALALAQQNLVTAQRKDSETAGSLAQTQILLKASDNLVQQNQDALDKAQAEVGQMAREQYQQNTTLIGIVTVVTPTTTGSMNDKLQWATTMFETSATAITRLEDTQAKLAEAKNTRAVLEARATIARQDAAAQLGESQKAQKAAADATAQVQAAVDANNAAKADAAAAVAQDQADAAVQQAEVDAVNARIAQRLADERAAQQAAAAAAARAKSGSTTTTTTTSPASSGLIKPIPGASITSPYGMRLHPILHIWKLHDGTDFGAGCGTPIHAAASGTVTEEYYNGGYGNRLFIDHGNIGGVFMTTAYNHMNGYAVSVGQHVTQGQVIGYVGTTGYSTGCHLHFMLWVNGTMVNPANYL
jgi:murein DD-endopeptidase MepM/ murein hydrolase activator NlpD